MEIFSLVFSYLMSYSYGGKPSDADISWISQAEPQECVFRVDPADRKCPCLLLILFALPGLDCCGEDGQPSRLMPYLGICLCSQQDSGMKHLPCLVSLLDHDHRTAVMP